MRETWAAWEWELSVLSSWGSRHFLTRSPSPLQEKLQLRRPLLELVVLLGVGWQESQLILLLSSMCSMFIFFFLQWWAEISHLYCYVPTRTLFSGPPLLGINLKELKAQTQTHYCAPEVIAALFMIAKRWKQLKCPLTHEWISNTWYIHTLGYHSVIKSTEVLTHAAIWQTLKTA